MANADIRPAIVPQIPSSAARLVTQAYQAKPDDTTVGDHRIDATVTPTLILNP